jgi:hypothetical protein
MNCKLTPYSLGGFFCNVCQYHTFDQDEERECPGEAPKEAAPQKKGCHHCGQRKKPKRNPAAEAAYKQNLLRLAAQRKSKPSR